MAICRIAMLAYIWKDMPAFDGYTEQDLRDMIVWCNDMIDQGLTYEPIDRFSLRGFIKWANKQLKDHQ
jgi:hypothetical protein